tara:strand:+ start:4398 stop:4565 length:168 start_codon:yes stop_codon:yes gene_type:complete
MCCTKPVTKKQREIDRMSAKEYSFFLAHGDDALDKEKMTNDEYDEYLKSNLIFDI